LWIFGLSIYFDYWTCLSGLEMSPSAFNNVENQIGFCGIWCGSCPGGNGSVIELTRKYEKALRNNNLEIWAPKGFDTVGFMKALTSLQNTQLCRGCLKGGGDASCSIRACAEQKKIHSCAECGLLPNCVNFESLEKAYPSIRSDLLKIKGANQRFLVKRWKLTLKRSFPNCLLVCHKE
jgi:hypothetical protein